MISSNYAEYYGSDGKHHHIIERLGDGSIRVTRGSTKAQLRLIAKHCGFDYDMSWTTQQLGSKLINFLHEQDPSSVMISDAKKMAVFKGADGLYKHTIEQSKKNIITVTPDSTKAILRLLFADLGESYDDGWNTRTMGAKLIELLNSESYNNDEIDECAFENEKPDENWAWWLSLDANMRFLLLYDLEYDLLSDDYGYTETNEDGDLCVYYDEDLQTDDTGPMRVIVDDCIMETDELYVTDASLSEVGNCAVEFCFEGFAELGYLPELTGLSFADDHSLSFVPQGLDNLKRLTYLDFNGANIGEDDPEEDIKTLMAILKSLPNLTRLDLENTPLADYLEENPDTYDELRKLAPKCDIYPD